MKIIDPGHVYELQFLDGPPQWHFGCGMSNDVLTFVKREGEGYPGNVGHHPGTTIQEVLRALIDRVKYLDNQIPHPRNQDVLMSLRCAIYDLEIRAAERHHRLSEFQRLIMQGVGIEIELAPVCSKCLHIGCDGGCHP